MDLMVSSSSKSGGRDIKQLVRDCTMMVEAQNSTTYLINNTLLLLARHIDWQVQARAEVQAIHPLSSAFDEDADNLSLIYPKLAKLKVVSNLILAFPLIRISNLPVRHR